MGHGCYYTHDTLPDTRAVWVKLDPEYQDEDDGFYAYKDTFDDVCRTLEGIGYTFNAPNDTEWSKGSMFDVKLGGHHDGDILIRLECAGDFQDGMQGHGIAKYQHPRVFKSIIRALLKDGHAIYFGASALCSGEITLDNINDINL